MKQPNSEENSKSEVSTKKPFSPNIRFPFTSFSEDDYKSEGLFCSEKVTAGIILLRGQELKSSTVFCESLVCSSAAESAERPSIKKEKPTHEM